MLLLIASTVLGSAPTAFPERVPGMIEACLANAVETGEVSDTERSHKYICTGEVAQRLWTFLEEANVEPYDEDAGEEGHWLGREFPLGACFKHIRRADGSPAPGALSCTVWIPRPAP